MKSLKSMLLCAALALTAQQSQAITVRCMGPAALFGSSVSPNGSSYEYEFSVAGLDNTCPEYVERLTDFYLPYFADAGITNIRAASGWSFAIENSDAIFGLGHNAGQLHFFADSAASYIAGAPVGGFGYTAGYSGIKAPYFERLVHLDGSPDTLMGDPLIPGSPDAIEALSPPASVPEPATTALALIGLAGFIGARRRAS